MELPQLSLDTFVAICLVIATPWLYKTYSPFSSEKSSKSRTEQLLSTAILVHTLYMLHSLLVSPPQNIFKSLELSLNEAPETLRAKLAESFGGDENVPLHLDILLKRLGLMDMRSFYVRFGHNVLTTCSYCNSFDDFALYAFPAPLLEYIREIAFVGLLALPKSPAAHFRPLGLGALLAALMAEAYWVLTLQVVIPPRGSYLPATMWHDNFVQIRHALFLLLPLLITLLPYLNLHSIPILGAFIPAPQVHNLPPARYQLQGQNAVVPPDATLTQVSNMTLKTLGHLLPTLHLLKYSHAAVMRSQSPTDEATAASLHSRAAEWWRDEGREGEVVRSDENVQKILKGAGLGVDEESKEGDAVIEPEGKLLNSAKIAVNMLKEQGGPPSEHWVFGP
ncbi:hypothetical protein GALMADRAFT_257008 [Galerina marginata CBS 339.88]|uniref:Uncharacterized protein n=1 Tax=Galerina marginata (strain CBS 339.88) TaxID=685588 RepID=A0A067SKX1_GALM3|nr:hypothetical protein GALMADRAFT_257008 [Galerina marginata CBS 339.88]